MVALRAGQREEAAVPRAQGLHPASRRNSSFCENDLPM